MLGCAWSLSIVYILLNYDEIIRTGWQIPKIFSVIFSLIMCGGFFSYFMLRNASYMTHYVEVKQSPLDLDKKLAEEEEGEFELKPLKTVYVNKTI